MWVKYSGEKNRQFSIFGVNPKGIKMSRTSTNTNYSRVPNPVRYFISYSGANGTFSYWDKDAKERVEIGNSVDLVLMDTRSAVTGWSEEFGGRIFSNRVKSTTKEQFNVRCGKNAISEGLWADIKDRVKTAGGKFCTDVFALANVNGSWEPVQLELSGASLGDWMTMLDEVGGRNSLYSVVLTMSKGEQKKKGAVKFFGLTFSNAELDSKLSEQANIFNDDMLQPYLSEGAPTATAV
jgi:hypothetical protein